ncbi:MAG: hypothetical protein IPJ27_23745 [Candidatus Accumulibacter sp.]|uniref:Uncharacterized protein n=1 Tax=Candidatus Accumulibacter proximus TaxID=2954385 RepID=A0A935UI88_9PROT|nr:hypothetical protein [Candidatus Accumulibacter proximus]
MLDDHGLTLQSSGGKAASHCFIRGSWCIPPESPIPPGCQEFITRHLEKVAAASGFVGPQGGYLGVCRGGGGPPPGAPPPPPAGGGGAGGAGGGGGKRAGGKGILALRQQKMERDFLVAPDPCFVKRIGGCRLVSNVAAPAAIVPTIRRPQRETG